MKVKSLKKWLLTALIQVGTVFIYFRVIRPLRGWFSEWIGPAIFSPSSAAAEPIQSIAKEGITIHTTYIFQGTELIFSYAPQFGFFFLIAIIGLNFYRPGVKIYLFLAGFHLIIEVFALLLSNFAINGYPIGFIAADFLLLYLSPLISLGFILFVVLTIKGKLRSEV